VNFLYISESPHPAYGGASKCVHTLFKSLVKLGHSCFTLSVASESRAFDLDGVVCIQTQEPKAYAHRIFKADNIDVLLTQLSGADWAIDYAFNFEVPSILRVPSFEHFCSSSTSFATCDYRCLTGVRCAHRCDFSVMFRKASAIEACSAFVARKCLDFYGRSANVIYPYIDADEHRVSSTGDRVTLIWGYPLKGLDIFLSIARLNPSFKYMIVGGVQVGTDLRGLDIVVLGLVSDMREVWRSTRVLLVPSIIAETFGRVCVEAALNGIPVVGSDRGGLLESIGKEHCYPVKNVQTWSNEVRRLVTDNNYYTQRSAQAREYASLFSLGGQVNKFLTVVRKLLSSSSIKLSVVTSLYRSAPYLQGYFDDLARQTFKDFEVVLVCNDPTGEERQIIESNRDGFCIRQIEVPKEPLYVSWNRALDLAEGEYVTIANADDRHFETAFQRYVEALSTNTEIDVVYNDYVRKNLQGDIIKLEIAPEFNVEELKRRCYTGTHVTFRREVVVQEGFFDTSFVVAGDYEYWLRLATRGHQFRRIPEVLTEYYEHPDAITYSNLNVMMAETQRAQAMYR